MSDSDQTPDIFHYADYRTFLRECYELRRKSDSKFSHRFIAQQVGASSTGWFANIISGKISLTDAYVLRLATLFKLNPRQKDFFKLLVQYSQAGTLEEKSFYYDKIVTNKGFQATIVSQEKFDFYNNWYIPVIRELLMIHAFSGNHAALAKLLVPPIKPAQAEQAIEVLRSLDFIRKVVGGAWKPRDTTITKDPSFKTLHWANLMRKKIQLAAEAIDRFPRDERDISDVQVPLSKEGFSEVSEEIRQLRQRILALSERDKDRTAVYQCNVQLFPLTIPHETK